jgi:hypothetical protein
MKRTFTIFISLMLAVGFFAFAQTGPSGKAEPLVFFVQQDLEPEVTRLGFDAGFQELLGRLDPGREISFYFYIQNRFKLVYEGEAAGMKWPAEESFAVPVPSTTPYKNLLRFLQENGMKGRTVIFVSNGVSQDMLQLVDTQGLLRGADTFSPSRYQPIENLRKYCKKNDIRILGLYVPVRSRFPGQVDRIPLDSFRYTVETSGGKAYYNFNTFTGVFRALDEKELARK